jgi:hypothetical protein
VVAVAEGIRIVRAQAGGAFHSRTIEKRIAAANKAKTKRLVRIRFVILISGGFGKQDPVPAFALRLVLPQIV